jgi:hypothetical protein
MGGWDQNGPYWDWLGGGWSGFTWLRIGTVGGLLWMRWWTFGFWRHGVVSATRYERYVFWTVNIYLIFSRFIYVILKLILEEQNCKSLLGLIWLRLGTENGMSWTRWWTIWFHRKRRIFDWGCYELLKVDSATRSNTDIDVIMSQTIFKTSFVLNLIFVASSFDEDFF